MTIGIRSKMKLISLIPILLLLAFASFFFYQSGNNYLEGQHFSQRLKYTKILNGLVTELAKERGMTAIYLGSRGHKVKTTLQKQRQVVDKQVSTFQQYLSQHPEIKSSDTVLSLLHSLPQTRQKIDRLKLSFDEAFFNYYTVLISNLLNDMERLTQYHIDNEVANEAKAYFDFAQAKEASGIERGFMSYILTRYTKMSDQELEKWIHYIGQADSFNYKFIDDIKLKSEISQLLQNQEAKEIFKKLAKARTAILHSINDGYYTIDPTQWFNLNTEKISILSKAQHLIIQSIQAKTDHVLQRDMYIAIGSALLWIIALILAVIGYIVSREITQNIKNLEEVLQDVAESTNQQLDINLDTAEGTAKAYELLKSIIEETRQEQIRAEEASEAKSLFLANMSHEIRTPLNGIVGFTELLKNTDLNGEQKEFVDIIEKSSENLLEIINNILDLSKIESNKIEIENIVFNPMEEFESAVDIYAVKAAEKNIDLGCFIDPRLVQPVKGDPTKIKEVLINLLSNAVKFTNQNGAINVEIRKVQSSTPDKTAISFSVEDTGIGISPDKKQHIFEAFSQADTSITRKFGGTGLGLTISARYVELMGGKLDLESEVGKGTRFFFTLEFEEMPKMNEDMAGQFANVVLAFLTSIAKTKKQDQYIKEYMDYFGAGLIPFHTPDELIKLAKERRAQASLIDADYASDNELRRMGKTSLHCNIIIKSTQQQRLEALRLHCQKIVYEPATYSKLVALLKIASSKTSQKTKKEAITSENIRFKAKALVAEDNTINQKLIKRTLNDLGIEVDLASNGLEAFEKRRNGDYDIIFMDISMPVMDGVEATHEILDYEEDENLPHIPIVALTANALKGDRERFLGEGLDEYTTKPLVKEEIISILKKFLSDKMYTADELQRQRQEEAQSQATEDVKNAENMEKESATATQESANESTDESVQKGEKPSPDVKADKVLVLKKSPLETKIFVELLKQLGYNIDFAYTTDQLIEKLDPEIGVIFVDRETEGLSLEELKKAMNERAPYAALILMTDPATEASDEDRKIADEVIVNLVNRDFIRLLLDKFINSKEG